jgi:hypothetical protein
MHASAAATGERVPEITPCNCGAPRPTTGLGPARTGGVARTPDHALADPKPDASKG